MRWAPFLGPAMRFENERLEQRWRDSTKYRRHIFDMGFFASFTVPTIVSSLKAIQVKTTLFPKVVYPVLSTFYISMCAFILLRPQAYGRIRGLFLGGFKLALTIIICNVVMIEEPSADTWYQFVRFELLLFQKGLIALIIAVCLPQSFLDHCAIQSCMVVLFLIFNPGTCAAFHGRQASNYGRYQQVVTGVDSMLLPSARSVRRMCPLSHCGQTYCMHVQAFLHIVTGFVLPSMILFALESRSRIKFLQERLEASGERLPGPSHRADRRRAWLVIYLMNLSIGLALIWFWLGWLYSQELASYHLRRI